MKFSCLLGITAVVVGGSTAGPRSLDAQDNPAYDPVQDRVPGAAGDLMLRNLQPSGQPVIPLFDGWFRNPDDTVELCFGYHNLNTVENVQIPFGADNFIAPARFDGVQPTHFDQVPGVYRRRFCVFTVRLDDLADAPDVVWTLRVDGRSYTVPGSSSQHYRMDEILQSSRGNSAPLVRFDDEGHRGRATKLDGDTVNAPVGETLTLSATVSDPEETPLGTTRVLWTKHQGPGSVTFNEEAAEVVERSDTFYHTILAAFDEPGDYVLRVQVVDWDLGNAFGFHCCWTNRYVNVTVSP